MRKKKGNLKLFPLLIVILFIVVGIGFIFNEKSNNASREAKIIENEEKAVNKKEEKETESATINFLPDEINSFNFNKIGPAPFITVSRRASLRRRMLESRSLPTATPKGTTTIATISSCATSDAWKP